MNNLTFRQKYARLSIQVQVLTQPKYWKSKSCWRTPDKKHTTCYIGYYNLENNLLCETY